MGRPKGSKNKYKFPEKINRLVDVNKKYKINRCVPETEHTHDMVLCGDNFGATWEQCKGCGYKANLIETVSDIIERKEKHDISSFKWFVMGMLWAALILAIVIYFQR
jgi:hypothetical protein